MQWALGVMGITAVIPMVLWLPETLDPEKLNKVKVEGKTVLKVLNPFTGLVLLRSPNILVVVSRGLSLSPWPILTGLRLLRAQLLSSLTGVGRCYLWSHCAQLTPFSFVGPSLVHGRESYNLLFHANEFLP